MKELKWKDFKIKDLQPNLIDDGWDSFQPVGDTENLIPNGWDSFRLGGSGINYVPNWDFSTNENPYDIYGSVPFITNGMLNIKTPSTSQAPKYAFVRLKLKLDKGEYTYRVKVKDSYQLHILPFSGVSNKTNISVSDGGVGEGVFTVTGEEVELYLYPMETPGLGEVGDETWVEWLQVTKTQDQHLILEKKPLTNGLMRIQSWGGNSNIKFRYLGTSDIVKDTLYTDSVYIENKGQMFIISTNVNYNFKTVAKNEVGFFHKTGKAGVTGNNNFTFKTVDKNDNLDFIASSPIINEGDKPNLTLLKEKLDNGLTHIRAYGGQENGKLRFILNSEKVGDPLNLSMYINNMGSDITLHHDAPSTNDTIKSGHNGFFENITEVSVGNYKYVGIGTKGHLDFIASDPQLVESTKHNPVLIVDELEDGREHVQVHGAYVDTKLISKEVQGFSGEPYQIKTDIDNEGLELSMTSTLGDKSIDINKGSNSISHTGELKGNRIVVELGAKNG